MRTSNAFCSLAAILMSALLGQGCSATHQATFASPDDAVHALVNAVREDNRTELKRILGPESPQIVSSGDPVADRKNVQEFLQKYDRSHRIIAGEGDDLTLVVGEDDWPMPIPIVKDGIAWRFDTSRGKDEILNRRIGRNEMSAIQVCLAIVDAQRERAARDPGGVGLPEYAQKFFSDPGTKNGLFWQTVEGEEPSPLGALVASAAEEGYTADRHAPYHGYFYRMLKAQGPAAAGGTRDYVVNGKMIGGFAVVAYPAEYGNSGVMSFIVNNDGIVYEKDLGPDTPRVAKAMTAYDPGTGWKKIE
jgi:DUF2950 family protein